MTQASLKQSPRQPAGKSTQAAGKTGRSVTGKDAARKTGAGTAGPRQRTVTQTASTKGVSTTATATKAAGAKRVVAKAAPKPAGRKVQVRRSGVHGKGVFAARAIAKDETIIEYRGEIITWDEANRRHPHDPNDPNHTFYFHLDDSHVIDGKVTGNAAKWINHSCAPNCESELDGQRVFIKALRAIKPGEELFFDYGLVIDQRITPTLKREYRCLCGAKDCRGTMLALRKRAR